VNLCQNLRTVLPGGIIESINLTAINPDDSNCVGKYLSVALLIFWTIFLSGGFEGGEFQYVDDESMANSYSLEVHYYTDLACTEGDTVAVVGRCEQASAPFLATNVICPA
jgi:hypothetical protein